jgi:hypothetical protein
MDINSVQLMAAHQQAAGKAAAAVQHTSALLERTTPSASDMDITRGGLWRNRLLVQNHVFQTLPLLLQSCTCSI